MTRETDDQQPKAKAAPTWVRVLAAGIIAAAQIVAGLIRINREDHAPAPSPSPSKVECLYDQWGDIENPDCLDAPPYR
jgi:hypothetical protein